jgi:cytosine/adenosine deaminase-related metal-dependent hydrolase
VVDIAALLAQASCVAFLNANVVPMDSPRVLRNRTVVVRSGRIESVQAAVTAKVPAGALRIDARGRYLMPGLTDMHVHVWHASDLPLYLVNGVTTVRNMNGRPYHLAWRAEIERGDRLGPRLYTSGPTIYEDPEDPGELVRSQKEAGYDFVKVYHFISGGAHRAILRAAQAHGMPVVGHKSKGIPLPELMKTNQRSIEHLQGYIFLLESPGSPLRAALRRGQWSHRYHYLGVDIEANRIPDVAAATRDARFWNCPTIVSGDRWIPRDELERLERQPHMRYVRPPLSERGSVEQYLGDSTAEIRALGRKNRRLLVRELHAAGTRLLLGTDAGAAYVEPGFSIHAELQNLVESGLSAYDALRTGTWNAAEFLGVLDGADSITAGKRADLVLLRGNPLVDLRHLREPIGIMVGGRWHPAAELLHVLDEQERAGRAENGPAIGAGRFTLRRCSCNPVSVTKWSYGASFSCCRSPVGWTLAPSTSSKQGAIRGSAVMVIVPRCNPRAPPPRWIQRKSLTCLMERDDYESVGRAFESPECTLDKLMAHDGRPEEPPLRGPSVFTGEAHVDRESGTGSPMRGPGALLSEESLSLGPCEEAWPRPVSAAGTLGKEPSSATSSLSRVKRFMAYS